MHNSYIKWMEDGQPKIFCECECGQEIIIKSWHKWNGVPKYIHGHNPQGNMYKKGNIPWNVGLVDAQDYHIPWNKGKKLSEEHKNKISESNKDQVPWIKGKNQSEETREKMRKSHEGIVISEETKEKLRQYCGDKHWNWKGGISKTPYCDKWTEELRERIRVRDGRICQECDKAELENGRKLHVHHIHYKKEDCDPDLIALCISCNVKSNYNRDYWEEHFMNKLRMRGLLKNEN